MSKVDPENPVLANLDNLGIAELNNLSDTVKNRIALLREDHVRGLREMVEAQFQAEGVTLQEVFPELAVEEAKKSAKRKPPTHIFQHPMDKTTTWSGRGRTPKWFEALPHDRRLACKVPNPLAK